VERGDRGHVDDDAVDELHPRIRIENARLAHPVKLVDGEAMRDRLE
jgi:hypothetical protein